MGEAAAPEKKYEISFSCYCSSRCFYSWSAPAPWTSFHKLFLLLLTLCWLKLPWSPVLLLHLAVLYRVVQDVRLGGCVLTLKLYILAVLLFLGTVNYDSIHLQYILHMTTFYLWTWTDSCRFQQFLRQDIRDGGNILVLKYKTEYCFRNSKLLWSNHRQVRSTWSQGMESSGVLQERVAWASPSGCNPC